MSETIRAIREIGELMTEKGWDKNGSSGCVKRDASGKIIAYWASPDFMRDFDDARDTLAAREALEELTSRGAV